MLSLSYLPTAERLTVVIVKARNLMFPNQKDSGDPFVKVSCQPKRSEKQRGAGVGGTLERSTIFPWAIFSLADISFIPPFYIFLSPASFWNLHSSISTRLICWVGGIFNICPFCRSICWSRARNCIKRRLRLKGVKEARYLMKRWYSKYRLQHFMCVSLFLSIAYFCQTLFTLIFLKLFYRRSSCVLLLLNIQENRRLIPLAMWF